jgi:phosphoribosyl-ATP pyrophosphohydrolase/phosphoribosyl-AMP cyclohydrolase
MTGLPFTIDPEKVAWNKGDGLVPAVVQDAASLRVLMLGYVNREALAQTLSSGLVTFYSRSKQRLWQKGETSGHVLRLVDVKLDCDNDTFLFLAHPEGPTCHTGTLTCFGNDPLPSLATLADLAATIQMRQVQPSAASYTSQLFAEGVTRIAQKVGEEGVETALAAATHSMTLASEAADLIYHLLVLLQASGQSLFDVLKILHKRAHPKN